MRLFFFDYFVSRSSILSRASSSSSYFRAFRANSREVSSNLNPPSVSQEQIDHLSYTKDFCSLIHDFPKNNRNFRLLSVLDSMLSKTHFLDSATSVLVIEGLCRLKKLNRAKAVLLDLKRKGKVSDFFLYSLVFQCMVRDGRISDVELVWNEICGSESSVRTDASDFVVYISKFGDGLEIESVCKRVLMDGGTLRQQSYVALIGALCRKDDCLLAVEVLQELKEKGFVLDDLTYIALFQSLCRNGKLSEADLILRNLVRRECSLDVCVYGSFMYGLCKSGKLKEAEKLFHRLIEKGHSVNGDSPRLKMGRRVIFQLNCRGKVPQIMVYETYCRSLCSAGKVDEAELLLKEMLWKKMAPEICVYRSFIKALFRAGRSDDAIRFFDVERKKGLVQAEEIAVAVIMGLCELGRVDDARELLNEMAKDGFVPTVSVWNCVLVGYWKQRRVDEVMDLFERMDEGSCRKPDMWTTYTVMVNGFCEHKKVEQAISIYRKMIENKIPVNRAMYNAIIGQLCERGRTEEAHNYVNEMIETGHLTSYVGWKSLSDCINSSSRNNMSYGF
ncbi:hypothetical protein AAC387_Pa02g4280 [Persea americana]